AGATHDLHAGHLATGADEDLERDGAANPLLACRERVHGLDALDEDRRRPRGGLGLLLTGLVRVRDGGEEKKKKEAPAAAKGAVLHLSASGPGAGARTRPRGRAASAPG